MPTKPRTRLFFLVPLATRPLVQSAVFFGGNFNGGRWPPRHLDERNQRDKKKYGQKEGRKKGHMSIAKVIQVTAVNSQVQYIKNRREGSYRAARGSYAHCCVCVSPSFSFSSTAGQRRWDFRSDFHRLTAIVISARRIGKSINWRKLCVEDQQIDCGGCQLEPNIAHGESKLNNFLRRSYLPSV